MRRALIPPAWRGAPHSCVPYRRAVSLSCQGTGTHTHLGGEDTGAHAFRAPRRRTRPGRRRAAPVRARRARHAPVRRLRPRAVLRDPLRLLRLQHLHRLGPGADPVVDERPGLARVVAGGAATGAGPGRPRAGVATAGRHRVPRRRHAVAARGRRARRGAGRGAVVVRAGPWRRGDHGGQPGVDDAGAAQRDRRRRVHPPLAGHAVRRRPRARRPRPPAHPRRCRLRGLGRAGGRARPRQPRPHLRDADGDRGRPAAVAWTRSWLRAPTTSRPTP